MTYTTRETYEFISKQTNDPIVEWKTCKISGQPFPIYQSDLDFYDKISPTFNGKKYQISTPTLCPEERERRRLAFRNERKLYNRTCDFSEKPIISAYSPDKPFKIYNQQVWRSDQRDAINYGRDYDFNQTFSENFKALLYEVPLPALTNLNAENAEYCNRCNYNKNCYLTFMTSYSQDSMYGTFIQRSQDCVDCTVAFECDNCYDCYNIDNCTGLFYSHNCHDCSLSSYVDFCRGCSNCYACHNLHNQQYCIFNVPYTREAYFERIKTIYPEQIQEFKKQIQRERTVVKSENCFGRDLTTSKNCILSYNGFEAEDCKYCLNYGDLKDSYDCSAFGHQCALCFESIAGEENYHTAFTFTVLGGKDIRYSMFCPQNVSHLFACVGLRNKQYCILNKQYEKADYEATVARIVEQMQKTGERGQFFHPSLSPFGYNETVAQEYYPSTFEQVHSQGFNWSLYEAPQPTADIVIQGEDLPATIEEVNDDILQAVIACEVTGKLFRIQAKELAFYRKHHLPLPRRHPDQRHLERNVWKTPKDQIEWE